MDQHPAPPSLPGQQPPQQPKKTSGLAIAALVLSILCTPVGLVLGIVALVKINRNPALEGKTLAIIAIVLSSLFLCICVPIQAAVAIPNFVRFQARAKQSECKVNLKTAYVAAISREEGPSERLDQLGISFEEKRRYGYFFGADVVDSGPEATAAAPTASDLSLSELTSGLDATGLQPGLTEQGLTVACVGNIDTDDTLDVWSVATFERPGIPAGEPFNHVNDVTD